MKVILKSLYQHSRNKEVKELIFNAFSKDYNIRANAASDLNTQVCILEFLSKDKDSNVRSYIALNLSTPIHILEKLSNDENSDVRYWAARRNPNFRNKNR